MSFNRLALFICCLMLAVGLAFTAQAKKYSLAGGGLEIAIGQGLPVPAQVFTPSQTGTNFPTLLVPANTKKLIDQTTAMTVDQKITVPKSALYTSPHQATVGLFDQNPALYAVATNLGFAWPANPAVLSTGARTGNKTTTFTAVGGLIRYSNASASKFGGPARFSITHGSGGIVPNSPVTIYLIYKQPTGNPPCTHTALTPTYFNGTFANPACVAVLGGAWPLTQGVIGASVGLSATTVPQGKPLPGVGIGKFGQSPKGTVSFFAFTPNGTVSGFTNQAHSVGYPWTTGMLTVSHPGAGGTGELFIITGGDNRTSGGVGTIQLVAGSLSTRVASGPNANRGWVRLQLGPYDQPVPSMSPAGIAATAGLMLLAVGYVMRRRLSR